MGEYIAFAIDDPNLRERFGATCAAFALPLVEGETTDGLSRKIEQTPGTCKAVVSASQKINALELQQRIHNYRPGLPVIITTNKGLTRILEEWQRLYAEQRHITWDLVIEVMQKNASLPGRKPEPEPKNSSGSETDQEEEKMREELLRCSVDGHEYQHNSFADYVHQFIELPIDADEEKRGEIICAVFGMPWSVGFFDGLLWELEMHFLKIVDEHPEPEFRNAEEYRNWIHNIWDRVGIILIQNGKPEYAESLYKKLLSVQGRAQSKWGWIPKGTAFHHIGVSKLATRRPEERREAEPYFVAALIEDMLYSLFNNLERNRYKKFPAYRVLSSEYQKQQSFFDYINRRVLDVFSQKDSAIGKFLIENADVLYLDRIVAVPLKD